MVLTLGYLSNSWVSLSLIDGVLQVAEKLMNPFGDDDDHFEINGILDSNLEVSHWGVLVASKRSRVRLPAGALSGRVGQLSLPSLRGR